MQMEANIEGVETKITILTVNLRQDNIYELRELDVGPINQDYTSCNGSEKLKPLCFSPGDYIKSGFSLSICGLDFSLDHDEDFV